MKRYGWLAGVVAAAVAGCGPAARQLPPTGGPVVGEVTLDGKPLAAGTIDFEADDGTPPQRAEVRDGKFAGKVRPGKYKVSVQAYRPKVPPPEPAPGGFPVDPNEQYLPDRYNTATELRAEVPTAGGLKFELKSDGAK